MPAPILATKLYLPPPQPGIVFRPRLIERLNQGLQHTPGVSLISAPAGFGKTTQVSEWVAGCGRTVAWLSLDEGDSDPARFLTYLVAALQTITKDIGKGVLAAIQTAQPLTTINETLLATLLNEISAIPEHFILVLDDYHLIDCEPIDQALTFLIDHQPPHMHLVIATRADPSLPLPRYRVRGQLTELRAADLRFTAEEAGAFLNQMMNLSLSVENIAALETRTEGWIAGLQLAALSLQGREDIPSFIQAFTGSHRFVLDYLAEEVLHRQPEPVRSFLLQTALLDRLCAPLCNAVTGREDGKDMLHVLERSNLFLIPLDDQRQWYRYHRLFAEVLQAHLMEAQPDRVASLHGRASAWYERNGLRSDAIRHALAAKDFERAAGLIELAWPAAEWGSMQQAAWLAWVKALPEALLHARPVLTVGYAYVLLGRGELEAAQARLQDAERWLEPAERMQAQPETPSGETCPESFDGVYPENSRRTQDKILLGMVVVDQEQWKSLPASIAIGRAYIAQALGNIPDTVRYASRVLEFPEANPFRHSQASMMLGMACWASGDLQAAERTFADYTMKLRAAGNIPDAIGTTVVLADIRLALGRLQEAILTSEQLLQFVMDQGGPISLDAADLHRELCELYLEQGNLEAADQHLQQSKELGEKAELPVGRFRWWIAHARLNETQGDLVGALAHLDEAQRLYIRTPFPDLCPISAMKARIWLKQGRLDKALDWAGAQGLSPEDDLCFLREYEHLTLARILIAQYRNERMDGTIQAAMRLLDRLLQAAQEGGPRVGSVIEILVLQALALEELGSLPPALVALERALALAKPEGYVHIFVDEGEPIRLLIADFRPAPGVGPVLQIEKQKCDQDHKLIGYIDRLLAAFVRPASIPQSKIDNLKSTMVEPLSDRELDVLRLLRSELNGPEIARELMVSLSTLRTHTQNIFSKLGVNNRRAAVRRAEELDLF